ncbi:uncharacterized protein LOC119102566 [Pollicipes pollicipes]|uniref:uncharacterized protein LOC119102566 n=1 Tax=Pollicipes pollicipes TaxID=41117 RepID=UPI0018858C6F|nr:uncharacterized protein LOC119102566 [Pollicipes pollicipes]
MISKISVLSTIAVVVLFWPSYCGSIKSSFKYKIVDLETNLDMCSGGNSRESNKISIWPDEPAIIRLGHMLIYNPANVQRCDLKIHAPRGYGVSMTINSMHLNFRRNEFTGSISCHDYVQFFRKWDSFLAKALAKVSDSFADKSDVICRQNYKVDIPRPELYHVGKTANIFYTLKNKIEFRYRSGEENNRDKEFTIVATAFKSTNGSCPDKYIRCGVESISFCIADSLRCDSFINCGFPSSGVDEQGCGEDVWHVDSAMSTHTFIWVTLVLTLAVFICCLISCAMRCWAGPAPAAGSGQLRLWFGNSRSPAGSGPTSSSGGPAPAERQHLSPLPSYDSVVRDLGSHDAGLQSPPAYKDLFPEQAGIEMVPLDPTKRTADGRPPRP